MRFYTKKETARRQPLKIIIMKLFCHEAVRLCMSLSIFMENSLHNTAGCLAVTIRVACLCHTVVLFFISQQLLGFFIYNLFISTNELDSTCLHRLRAFCGITEYQNRLA